MVCLRNICINTLHKGDNDVDDDDDDDDDDNDDDDDDDDDDDNNNNNKVKINPITGPVVAQRLGRSIAILFHDVGARRG